MLSGGIRMKKLLGIILILLFLISSLAGIQSVKASTHFWNLLDSGNSKIDPSLQASLAGTQSGSMLTVIVTLKDQVDLNNPALQNRPDRQQAVIKALQAQAQASQRAILAVLEAAKKQGSATQVISFWIFDGLSVTGTPGLIESLANREDVLSITPDNIDIVPVGVASLATPESNLAVVNAPELWNLGDYGQGAVIANLDSGVDVNHPELSSRWRSGSNSWYDPYNQHPNTPTDLSGHGTWTMGVMVGGDASGTTIGVAPQAQWIAAKIFNDSGSATATAIHLAFQWLLDPDGNAATEDAPQVVNNSWAFGSPGCNLEFQYDLRALRAIGILPVFSAGNHGPSSSSSVSPANYPEAFAVGAVDNSGGILADSSRGPSACGETSSIYPELVAPGVNIKTTDRFGLYTNSTGTSIAAPHVTGALAMLLNAFPGLNVESQAAALATTAFDLGSNGPDNDFGYGRLDVLAAYNWLAAGNRATPTPTPTATATPMPTATPTADVSVNQALGKSVSVSSTQDSSHTGSMAVDGDLGTFWQTGRATGKNKLPSEWITVDLGRDLSLGKVVLEWGAYYATSYTLEASSDNSSWTTVFSTSTEDGASDSITFAPVTARYIKLNTTAWNSGSSRDWLREFQVYASGGAAPTPTPTSSPSATPTSTPDPSPTPTPGSGFTIHIGDLDGAAATQNRNNWSATTTVLVHDANENPVVGASVFGHWSGGISTSGSCTTDVSGYCQLSSGNIKVNYNTATFTVTNITHAGDIYDSANNHDPDGDSNGTNLAISKP
jgi:serine protease AprX